MVLVLSVKLSNETNETETFYGSYILKPQLSNVRQSRVMELDNKIKFLTSVHRTSNGEKENVSAICRDYLVVSTVDSDYSVPQERTTRVCTRSIMKKSCGAGLVYSTFVT